MNDAMTLTNFLLARIAEDEAVAQDLVARDVFAPTQGPDMARVHEDDEYAALSVGAGRVLIECEAKRLVIDAAWADHERIEGEWGMCQSREQMDAKGDVPDVVAHLAAIYADHPDYREEWRP